MENLHSIAYGQDTFVAVGHDGIILQSASVALLLTPVVLHSQRSDSNLILSWRTSAVGLTLQSTPSLTPPVTGTDVAQPPSVSGTEFTVRNALSGSVPFYRPKKS